MSEFEQKVLNILEDINGKLDKLLKTEPAPVDSASASSAPVGSASESSTPTPSAAPTPAATTVKPSAIVEKQEIAARMEEKPPVEGRRVCPECGGTAFATHEDKSQVLHQMGGVKIYAKAYICKKCGYKH